MGKSSGNKNRDRNPGARQRKKANAQTSVDNTTSSEKNSPSHDDELKSSSKTSYAEITQTCVAQMDPPLPVKMPTAENDADSDDEIVMVPTPDIIEEEIYQEAQRKRVDGAGGGANAYYLNESQQLDANRTLAPQEIKDDHCRRP